MARKKKTKSAILPGNFVDPTGVDRLERGAIKEFSHRMKQAGKAYSQIINRIPASPSVNKRYTFDLDQTLLSMLLNNASIMVDEILGASNERDFWFWNNYVKPAYQRGTAQEFANLSQQFDVYAAGQVSLDAVLMSDPYLRRLVLVRSRVFEEMKNLSAGVKADLSRILTDGMGRGQSPAEVAKRIAKQAGLETSRAKRIARTEITTALRRARWDEADDAKERYGTQTKLMHISALSPTTRITHAHRHAHLYTSDEVRDWYAIDANSINCKCSQISVRVDDDGNPVNNTVMIRAKKIYNDLKSRGYKWAEG